MAILAGPKKPAKTAAKSKAKSAKAAQELGAKPKASAKSPAKRPAAKSTPKAKPKGAPKAALKMTKKDVYSRAYHKAKLEVAGNVTGEQAAEYARRKAKAAVDAADLPPWGNFKAERCGLEWKNSSRKCPTSHAWIFLFGLPPVKSNIGNRLCLNLLVYATKKFKHAKKLCLDLLVLATWKFAACMLCSGACTTNMSLNAGVILIDWLMHDRRHIAHTCCEHMSRDWWHWKRRFMAWIMKVKETCCKSMSCDVLPERDISVYFSDCFSRCQRHFWGSHIANNSLIWNTCLTRAVIISQKHTVLPWSSPWLPHLLIRRLSQFTFWQGFWAACLVLSARSQEWSGNLFAHGLVVTLALLNWFALCTWYAQGWSTFAWNLAATGASHQTIKCTLAWDRLWMLLCLWKSMNVSDLWKFSMYIEMLQWGATISMANGSKLTAWTASATSP